MTVNDALDCILFTLAATVSGWVGVRRVQAIRWRRSLCAYELRLPRTATVEEVAHWLGALRAMLPPRRWWSLLNRRAIVIETTATRTGIRRVLLVPKGLRTGVVSTMAAIVPAARLDELPTSDSGGGSGAAGPVRFLAAGDARLRGDCGLLDVGRAADTSRHALAALQPLQDGETTRVQWIVSGARAPAWIASPATNPRDLPDMWRAGDPMLSAVCRVGVASRFGARRARIVFARVWAPLRAMNTARVRVARRWWIPGWWAAQRLTRRGLPWAWWPITTTAPELAGLLGFAAGATALPGVAGGVSRTLPVPPAMPHTGVPLAKSNHPGTAADIRLSTTDRLQHVWALGPTGTGKTTLLANMTLHDISAGHGAVVVDAGGALVSRILERIPDDRAGDVIVIDPAATDFAIGLNPLEAGPPEQAATFAYHVLHSIYQKSWGPRTADILRAGLLTLAMTRAANGDRFTLVEMPELLTNNAFRRTVITQPLNPHIMSFWRWYESLSEPARLNAVGPVLNKLRAFTLSTPLRLMLGQTPGIGFADVLASRKIVLVTLRKGLLGAETAALIGSLITSSVWQAALGRTLIPEGKRTPFWLMLDEFQDTVRLPIDIADVLAQARNLGLGLTLAHQFLGQLARDMQASVLGTARTHVVFQLGVQDATTLAPSFMPLTADDLRHLAAFEVAIRPSVGRATLAPVTGTTHPLPDPSRDGDALAESSRQLFGKPAGDVEAATLDRLSVPVGKRKNHITFGGEK